MSEAQDVKADGAPQESQEKSAFSEKLGEYLATAPRAEAVRAEAALKAAAEKAPSGSGAAAGTGTTSGAAELERRVALLEKERDELKKEALLARADLDNYQKRIRREMDEVRTYAAQGVLTDLLGALDNVCFTIAAAKQKPEFDQLLLGVEMVQTQIEKILEGRGAARIPAEGVPFDPRKHEGILTEERKDVPENTAIQELRRGYQLKDRVLRAAQVKVSRAPAS